MPDLRFLHALGPADPVPDAALLGRFAADRDGPAFELLVRRHADLVWRVCRAVGRDHHAAEDAFQATFLALARKAAQVRGSVPGWLYRVAYHAALKSRRAGSRERPEEVPETPDADASRLDPDDCAALHDELARLPEAHRLPVVLCYLDGLSHAEAAARLGLAVGTVASRLSRAKDRLRERLIRRGVTVPAAGIAALLPAASAPADVLRGGLTVFAAPSPKLVTLAEGAVSAMTPTFPLKLLAGAALAAGLVLGAVAAPTPPQPPPPEKPAAKSDDLARLQGKWKVVAIRGPGKQTTPEEVAGMSWEVAGDVIVGRDAPDAVGERMRFTLDPATSPKRIDLTMLTGPAKSGEIGKTAAGIYSLGGDTLKVSVAPGDPTSGLRPTGFNPATAAVIELVRDTGPSPPTLDDLQGEWKLISSEVNGGIKSAEDLGGRYAVIRGEVITFRSPGVEPQEEKMVLRVRPETSPPQIDLTPVTGPVAVRGKPIPGVFGLSHDRFVLCIAHLTKTTDRPTRVAAGPGVDKMVFERISPAIPAGKVVGVWSRLEQWKQPNDTLLVWTFRDTGVVRSDALDAATGKPNPALRSLAGVGHWRLADRELVVTMEDWSDRAGMPEQRVFRWAVDSLDETGLVVRRVERPGSGIDTRPQRWDRFPGWDKVKK